MKAIHNSNRSRKGKAVDNGGNDSRSRAQLARQAKSPLRFTAQSAKETMALLEAVLLSWLPQDEKLRRLEAIVAAHDAELARDAEARAEEAARDAEEAAHD